MSDFPDELPRWRADMNGAWRYHVYLNDQKVSRCISADVASGKVTVARMVQQKVGEEMVDTAMTVVLKHGDDRARALEPGEVRIVRHTPPVGERTEE